MELPRSVHSVVVQRHVMAAQVLRARQATCASAKSKFVTPPPSPTLPSAYPNEEDWSYLTHVLGQPAGGDGGWSAGGDGADINRRADAAVWLWAIRRRVRKLLHLATRLRAGDRRRGRRAAPAQRVGWRQVGGRVGPPVSSYHGGRTIHAHGAARVNRPVTTRGVQYAARCPCSSPTTMGGLGGGATLGAAAACARSCASCLRML